MAGSATLTKTNTGTGRPAAFAAPAKELSWQHRLLPTSNALLFVSDTLSKRSLASCHAEEVQMNDDNQSPETAGHGQENDETSKLQNDPQADGRSTCTSEYVKCRCSMTCLGRSPKRAHMHVSLVSIGDIFTVNAAEEFL